LFKIYDGRDKFYQWDKDRKLIVEDKSISQVHFCNRTDDCALKCETYELDGLWVVNVPNILLQDDWRIRVYAYDGAATLHEARFDVVARSKPEDYVYTEDELKTWEDLSNRVTEIEENGISDEAVENAIGNYLNEHPFEAPVVSVNGKIGAVELTAEDVGALSADTEIPSTAGLATEKYVDDAVKNVSVDLSNYYNKTEVDNKISEIELTPGPAGKDGKDGKDYVLTDADKQEIAGMVEVTGGGDADLSNYYTKTEVDAKIPDTSGFMTEEDVEDYLSDELKIFAKKTYVDNAIEEALADFEPAGNETVIWEDDVSDGDIELKASVVEELIDLNGETIHITFTNADDDSEITFTSTVTYDKFGNMINFTGFEEATDGMITLLEIDADSNLLMILLSNDSQEGTLKFFVPAEKEYYTKEEIDGMFAAIVDGEEVAY
jgi:hypothetical protein